MELLPQLIDLYSQHNSQKNAHAHNFPEFNEMSHLVKPRV